MSNAREGADNSENPFLRLPEELLLSSIFGRLDDLKSLFLCSLVSKHFESVISHVRTVSITVSGSETYPKDYFRIMAKLVTELYDSTTEQIPTLLEPPSVQHMKLPKFLEKLRELQHIHLEYEYPENPVQPPFPTWEVKFAGNSAKIESFVALVQAGSMQFKDTENELDQEQEGGDQVQLILCDVKEILKCLSLFYGRYMEWICIVHMLLKHHTSLQRVTITDSGKHGKLVMGHEQLVNIGNQVLNVMEEFSQKILRTAWLPVLRLPLSGCVMRRSTLLMFHAPEDDPCASDDEMSVIGEAIQVILETHRDRIMKFGQLVFPDP